MKKLLLALFISFDLFGAPVGNPAAPHVLKEGFFIPPQYWVNVRAGYEGDFVSDGRMEQKHPASGIVDNYAQTTNSGTVTLNLLERLDLYALFGSSRTSAEWRFSGAEETIHHADMETSHALLWGIGFRAILVEWGAADLGIGSRYSNAKNKPSWLTIDGANASTVGAHFDWSEWQIDLDFSYKIDLLIPYLGVKYSSASTHLTNFPEPIGPNGSGENKFQNRIPVGLYVGCTLSTGKYFMLNFEGRLIDEEAISVSGDFRF